MNVATEDIRFATSENELSVKYQEALDPLDTALGKSMDYLS